MLSRDSVNLKSMQRRGGGYVHHEYTTVKSVFSVWHGTLTANWRYECHLVVSSRRSEPPHRTLASLSQCVSTAQRDAERRWTAETASSLGVAGVRRCTAERKSTEPCAWWPLFCTGCVLEIFSPLCPFALITSMVPIGDPGLDRRLYVIGYRSILSWFEINRSNLDEDMR